MFESICFPTGEGVAEARLGHEQVHQQELRDACATGHGPQPCRFGLAARWQCVGVGEGQESHREGHGDFQGQGCRGFLESRQSAQPWQERHGIAQRRQDRCAHLREVHGEAPGRFA